MGLIYFVRKKKFKTSLRGANSVLCYTMQTTGEKW